MGIQDLVRRVAAYVWSDARPPAQEDPLRALVSGREKYEVCAARDLEARGRGFSDWNVPSRVPAPQVDTFATLDAILSEQALLRVPQPFSGDGGTSAQGIQYLLPGDVGITLTKGEDRRAGDTLMSRAYVDVRFAKESGCPFIEDLLYGGKGGYSGRRFDVERELSHTRYARSTVQDGMLVMRRK